MVAPKVMKNQHPVVSTIKLLQHLLFRPDNKQLKQLLAQSLLLFLSQFQVLRLSYNHLLQ
jgi:hypothetical protein